MRPGCPGVWTLASPGKATVTGPLWLLPWERTKNYSQGRRQAQAPDQQSDVEQFLNCPGFPHLENRGHYMPSVSHREGHCLSVMSSGGYSGGGL